MPALHDDGAKTVLGHTANFDAASAVALVTGQPVAARFLAARMWSFFATPVGADDPVVTPLAAAVLGQRTGAALLRAVLLADEFSGEAVRAGLVKTPIEYVVGSLRALRLEPQARHVNLLRRLGQVPFAPPSVGGWPANAAWLTTASSQIRYQFARAAAAEADLSEIAASSRSERPAAVAHLLGVERWSDTTARALASMAGDPRALVTIALVAPEHVLN